MFVEGMCCDAHEIVDDKQAFLSLCVTDAESAVQKVAKCGSSTICFANRKKRNCLSLSLLASLLREHDKVVHVLSSPFTLLFSHV